MSSTKSLVEGFLNGERRKGTESEGATTTQSEIEDTVKSAVTEALEDHQQEFHADADEAESDTADEEETSGGRSKLKTVFLLGVLVGIGLFARRRMNDSDEESSI